ncbi:competence protein ComK [Sporosarcina sp. JAI121]|uniref:competence protein ComK n=1 Tax=Sporosarcina sp. JAI121 TaxID=2723064 RepID=UPI0015CEB5DC|nr:competence protein ComK [Sporosarcina sp. JAI121]NYF23886.1 competence protein ComK [Sporosarcina sp. JAI121]
MKKKKKTENYIVSFDTFMLQPVIKDNQVSTQVIERNGVVHVPRKPLHIVKKSCEYYAGSFQNSTNNAKLVIGKRHKLPIIVAHDFGVPYIFLPTMSPSADQNTWISHNAIENIEEHDLGSVILLENGQSFVLNVSATTMHRQHSFATILEKIFLKKQRQLNRLSPFRGNDDPDEG